MPRVLSHPNHKMLIPYLNYSKNIWSIDDAADKDFIKYFSFSGPMTRFSLMYIFLFNLRCEKFSNYVSSFIFFWDDRFPFQFA